MKTPFDNIRCYKLNAVAVGTVFDYKDNIYMKIERPSHAIDEDYAIRLKDGKVVPFDNPSVIDVHKHPNATIALGEQDVDSNVMF